MEHTLSAEELFFHTVSDALFSFLGVKSRTMSATNMTVPEKKFEYMRVSELFKGDMEAN